MNPPSPTSDSTPLDLRSLARAIRLPFVALVLGASYFNISLALGIPKYARVYSDMLNGTALPFSTLTILQYQYVWLGVSVLLPCTAMAFAIFSRLDKALIAIAILLFITLAQICLTWSAIWAPWATVMEKMQGGSAS